MKFVITGAYGQLGLAFQKELTRRGVEFFGTDLSTCDITSKAEVERLLDDQKPAVLINCAAYNLVDEAENDQAAAFEVNSHAVRTLALACRERGVKIVHYSSDYVFDGKKGSPYTEEDKTGPLNVYGLSKLESETVIRAIKGDHLIFRTSWVYGDGRQNFLYKFSQWAQKNDEIKVSVDEVSVPTYVEDIVGGTLSALEKGVCGLFHLTSSGQASRYEWAQAFVGASGLAVKVVPVPMSFFSLKAVRPKFSAMTNQKISKELKVRVPSWQEGVEKYVRSIREK